MKNKLTYRFDEYCMRNCTSAKERELISEFLEYYSDCDYGQQTRLNEMLGKLLQRIDDGKKSNGKSRPKWFPWDEIPRNIADHCERRNINGVDSILCHPYPMSEDDLHLIYKYCKKYNLKCIIDGKSHYYLGVTTRLIFQKNPDTKYKVGEKVTVEIPNHYGQDVWVEGVITEKENQQLVKVKSCPTKAKKDKKGDVEESLVIGWDGGYFDPYYIVD